MIDYATKLEIGITSDDSEKEVSDKIYNHAIDRVRDYFTSRLTSAQECNEYMNSMAETCFENKLSGIKLMTKALRLEGISA